MRIRLTEAIMVLGVLMCSASGASAASPGFRFLNLGAGSRAASMGDAHVAVGGDVSSMYWNPALLADQARSQASLTHLEWFQSFRLESASLGVNAGGVQFGAQVMGLYASQEDLIATDNTGAEQGHFGFYDLATSVGAARRVIPTLAVGLAGKVIVESIDNESYGSVAADAGAVWDTPLPGVRAGAAIGNLGPKSQSNGVDIDLPLTVRAGLAMSRMLPSPNARVLLAADVVSQRDEDTHLHLGAEVLFHDLIHLNGGWRSGYDSQAGSFGGGVQSGRAQVDYAYVSSSTGLGSTHRFTLRFDL